MKTHLKQNKEGKLVPAYKNSGELRKAQLNSISAKRAM